MKVRQLNSISTNWFSSLLHLVCARFLIGCVNRIESVYYIFYFGVVRFGNEEIQ